MTVHEKNALRPLNIVITRPAHQSQLLGNAIKTLGGNPIYLPSLAINPINIGAQITTLLPLITPNDIAIFVSANAVWHTKTLWQALPSSRRPLFIAIGPGTAKALSALDLPANITPQHYSSEGLLTLPELATPQNKSIYLCCGKNTKPLLTNTLIQRGAKVIPLVCYQRTPLTLSTKNLEHLSHTPIHCCVTTSLATLTSWHHMLKSAQQDWLLSTPTLVIANKYTPVAKNLGFTTVIESPDPTDESIIATLIDNRPTLLLNAN